MLIQHLFEVVSIVLAGRAGGDVVDEAVLEIDAHAELVAKVALAVFLGMGGIQILLPALGIASVRRLALRQSFLVFLADVLAWCGHQRGVNGLPTPGNVAMALQLGIHALQQCCSTVDSDALGKAPDGVANFRVLRGVIMRWLGRGSGTQGGVRGFERFPISESLHPGVAPFA